MVNLKNVRLLKDKVKFQSIIEAYIDFDATIEKLRKLGYIPRRYPAGRRRKDGGQQPDAGNLTFKLTSGATVNVSPKGQPHRIQATWNISVDKDKQYRELENALVFIETNRIPIVPIYSTSTIFTDDLDAFMDNMLDNEQN